MRTLNALTSSQLRALCALILKAQVCACALAQCAHILGVFERISNGALVRIHLGAVCAYSEQGARILR